MAYRTLKLQIQSAQALRYTNCIRGMRTYAYVFICDRNDKRISHKAKTKKDRDGDTNPKWNFDVMFSINIPKAEEHSLTLVVKLMSHHSVRPDTLIGEVRVPITELLKWFGDAAEDVHKEVNEHVKTSKGEEKGTLAFLFNFGKTLQHPPPDPTPVKGQPKVWKNLGRVTGPLIKAVSCCFRCCTCLS